MKRHARNLSRSAEVLTQVAAVASLLLVACLQPLAEARPSPAGGGTMTAVPALTHFASASESWVPAPRTKTAGCSSQAGLPDPSCTPGAVDSRVTQDNVGTTICARGYTVAVRPPVSVTNPIKRAQMAAYGLQGQRLGDFELDHLVSLELGGAPADVANLWPEPWTGDGGARQKDVVENFLKREVCRGTMQLADAQRQIATDWLAVYRGRGLQPAP